MPNPLTGLFRSPLDFSSLCLQMYSVHFRWSIMSVESASVSREQDEGCHKSQSLLQPQSNSVSGLSTEHGENSKSLKKVHFGQWEYTQTLI